MLRRTAPAMMLIAALLGGWEAAVRGFAVPAYILPPPSRVAVVFFARFPMLLGHAGVTLAEIVLGLLLASVGGFAIAVVLHYSKTLERALRPFIIASQMVPVFAIAPLLIVWLGYGLWPKVVVTALIGFFPVVVNALDGLRSASGEMIDLFLTMGASRAQTFRKLFLPASVPSLFSGLKIAATLSVVGATIGEWVGARRGLGYLMLQSNALLRVDLVFAAILMLTLIGLLLFAAFQIIERRMLRWRARDSGPLA